jgi:hypothetical protein
MRNSLLEPSNQIFQHLSSKSRPAHHPTLTAELLYVTSEYECPTTHHLNTFHIWTWLYSSVAYVKKQLRGASTKSYMLHFIEKNPIFTRIKVSVRVLYLQKNYSV